MSGRFSWTWLDTRKSRLPRENGRVPNCIPERRHLSRWTIPSRPQAAHIYVKLCHMIYLSPLSLNTTLSFKPFPIFTRKYTSNENMSTNSSSPSPFDDQTPHLWPHGCWIIYVYDSRSSPHLWMRHIDILTGCFVDLSTLGSLSPKPHACHALIEKWDSKTSHPAPIQSDIHLDQCAKAWRHVCLGKIRK